MGIETKGGRLQFTTPVINRWTCLLYHLKIWAKEPKLSRHLEAKVPLWRGKVAVVEERLIVTQGLVNVMVFPPFFSLSSQKKAHTPFS